MGLAERDGDGRDGDGAATERLTDVLARLRCELEEIAGRIDANQAAIARTTWTAGATDAEYVRAMQDADLSAQRIAGIAGFLRALCEAAHPHWRIDTATATRALTLSEMIRSIGTAGLDVQAKGVGENEAATGDVDLF